MMRTFFVQMHVLTGIARQMPALTDPSSKHLLAAPPTHRLLGSSEDKYKYHEVDGFLRLDSNKPRKNTPAYLEIVPNKLGSDSESSDSAEAAESSASESDTTPLTALQETLKEIETRISTCPSDIASWLRLLSHTLSTVAITTKNATRARSEITLSVLTRALSAHPDNARSRSLRIKYLKAGEEIWPEEKLRSEWEDALKVNDIELWMTWLDWTVRMGTRGVAGIVEDARRVLDVFPPQEEVARLRIMWRAAVALRDAGVSFRCAWSQYMSDPELAYRICGAGHRDLSSSGRTVRYEPLLLSTVR